MTTKIGKNLSVHPVEFMNWRLNVARAAGYGVEPFEVPGLTLFVPSIDYDNITTENTTGIWEEDPDDILVVLLAHSDECGMIYPSHTDKLADRLEGLLESIAEHAVGPKCKAVQFTQDLIKELREADGAMPFKVED